MLAISDIVSDMMQAKHAKEADARRYDADRAVLTDYIKEATADGEEVNLTSNGGQTIIYQSVEKVKVKGYEPTADQRAKMLDIVMAKFSDDPTGMFTVGELLAMGMKEAVTTQPLTLYTFREVARLPTKKKEE